MIREKFREHLSLIACILAIGLVLMFLLFVVQWYLIQQILGYAIELIEAELIQQAPSGVGASEIQLLRKIQIPLAMPTIMAGVNQTIMMSLSMVVVASMISVYGLGMMVLRGIGRLDMGLATVGGIGIVLIAIAVDRFSQSFGLTRRERDHKLWYQQGPIGFMLRLISSPRRHS